MYSLLTSKIQKSLAYALENSKPKIGASVEQKRSTFLDLFGLYRSLESFLVYLEKAFIELESIATGGVLVRTVIQNKLNKVKLAAEYLGNRLCGSLPYSGGIFPMKEADQLEYRFYEIGLYRLYIGQPSEGQAKSPGMAHYFSEICPYVKEEDGKASYEIAYTQTEPLLTVDKIYEGIDYRSVPSMDTQRHIAKYLSKNIEKHLIIKKVDVRASDQLAKLLASNKDNLSIITQRKMELSTLILSSFTIENLLSST